jgi:CysZ protein
MIPMLSPLTLALGQLDDRVFLGVLARSVLWSLAVLAALHVATIWAIHHLLHLRGALAMFGDVVGSVGASLVALWLFLPLAAIIGTLYFDRIAAAVEHRHYPWLPPPVGAPMIDQLWDGLAVGLRILLLQILALIMALLLPGIGLLLGWAIAAYAFGRGLFVAVAMRRMPRRQAEMLYHVVRPAGLCQGAALSLACSVPVLNLLVPVIGAAAMVHVLDYAATSRSSG